MSKSIKSSKINKSTKKETIKETIKDNEIFEDEIDFRDVI